MTASDSDVPIKAPEHENQVDSYENNTDVAAQGETSKEIKESRTDQQSGSDEMSSSADDMIATGQTTCTKLQEYGSQLKKLCKVSDPKFVKIGRDLATSTQDVKILVDTIHKAVSLVKDDKQDNVSLQETETLIQEIFTSLSDEKDAIKEEADHVKNLISRVFKSDQVREKIDRINTLFRIVRINIRIQCSARGLSDDLFEGVTEDLEHLSSTLHFATRQIVVDIKLGSKSLAKLQKSIHVHLVHLEEVFKQTQNIVAHAFSDIRQLMNATKTMIREADSRSQKISEMVGDIVVRIQFHDSLSQRVEHIAHAFDDICNLCGKDNVDLTDDHMGTTFIIVDLQLRQLLQISNEIKLVRERIENAFLAIESEVEGVSTILHDKQFREVSPQEFLGNVFSSLEDTLSRLTSLLGRRQEMVQEIEETADNTRSIAERLAEMQDSVTDIREETRVQAVNTIIMASALGHQGKTIEVLAKEIQALSDQSGELADDVEVMQFAVNKAVDDLVNVTTGTSGEIEQKEIEQQISSVKTTFSEVLEVVADITQQIDISGNHIRMTRNTLTFLEDLEAGLDSVISDLNQTRDTLAHWEGKGTSDSEEVEKLIERYSMSQERMIHMFDRADTDQQDDDNEDDIFF